MSLLFKTNEQLSKKFNKIQKYRKDLADEDEEDNVEPPSQLEFYEISGEDKSNNFCNFLNNKLKEPNNMYAYTNYNVFLKNGTAIQM